MTTLELDLKTVLEIALFIATLLGCTWRLSAQLSDVKNIAKGALDAAKSTSDMLVEHMNRDHEDFAKVHERIDRIAPVAHLRRDAG